MRAWVLWLSWAIHSWMRRGRWVAAGWLPCLTCLFIPALPPLQALPLGAKVEIEATALL